MTQNQNNVGIIKFEINGSWDVTELEIFTGERLSTLYNIILVTKSKDKVSKLFEFYKSLYETLFRFNSLPDNVEQTLKRILTYEIFQYQIDTSLVTKNDLKWTVLLWVHPEKGPSQETMRLSVQCFNFCIME